MLKTITTVAALAALTGTAMADTVSVDFKSRGGFGLNRQVTLAGGLTFGDGTTSKNLFIGQLVHEIDGHNFNTFCTELTEWAGDGEFRYDAVENAPESEDGMGLLKAGAIRSLFASVDTDFESSAAAAAFQAVIWEIVYDFDGNAESLDMAGLETGRVRIEGIKSSMFHNFAQAALGNSTERLGTGVVALVNDTYQDQLVAVPVPTAALLAAPVCGFVASRRRRA